MPAFAAGFARCWTPATELKDIKDFFKQPKDAIQASPFLFTPPCRRVVDGKKVRYLKKTGEVLPERIPERKPASSE